MCVGGPTDAWWCKAGNNYGHDAAYRAQQRALRNPIELGPDSQPPQANHKPPFESGASAAQGLDDASVLIFNVGRHNEGIYTHTHEDHVTTVLAFESPDDADHFSRLLLDQGFELATPMLWSAEQLSTLCRTTGCEVSIMPRGALPKLPSAPHHAPHDRRSDSARMPAKRDPYDGYRRWFEALLRSPSNCDDDDCSVLR